MSTDYPVVSYGVPPTGTGEPWKHTPIVFTPSVMPDPEEMKRIALESAVLEDLLRRVIALEKEVKALRRAARK
jgi:hypothetical protein